MRGLEQPKTDHATHICNSTFYYKMLFSYIYNIVNSVTVRVLQY